MLKYYLILSLFTSTFSVVGSCIKLNYCKKKTKQNQNFQKGKAVVFNGLFDKGWAVGRLCRLEWMRNQYFNQHVSVHHSGDLCPFLSCRPPKAASFNRSLHWHLNNNKQNKATEAQPFSSLSQRSCLFPVHIDRNCCFCSSVLQSVFLSTDVRIDIRLKHWTTIAQGFVWKMKRLLLCCVTHDKLGGVNEAMHVCWWVICHFACYSGECCYVSTTVRSNKISNRPEHSCCPQHTTGIFLFTGKDQNASKSKAILKRERAGCACVCVVCCSVTMDSSWILTKSTITGDLTISAGAWVEKK